MATKSFDAQFLALTGNDPFPWQRDLYENWLLQGKFPASCNLPTGLGKTSVVAVWLIALAKGADVPRRLVYVVNRRTVVDQTTDEVQKYRRNLAAAGIPFSLALSTLRGQFADNREWSADPSRPAVICGTVDMIGSRLLFSGYGIGFKSRPLHAGFLGQDALLVHDEAHLEPAFQRLLIAIEDEQKRCNDFRPLRVMELTATSRGGGETFGLTAEDHAEAEVVKRIEANKAIHLHENNDERKVAEEIAELALRHKDSGCAALVFVRKVDDVDKVVKKLPKDSFEQLTGTLRGLERDGLVKKPIFQRFLPSSNRDKDVTPAEGTVYLVCTSAGEVGVNISADHLVCDLSTFESMAQRLGRVNRFGDRDNARIDVVYPTEFDENRAYEMALKKTLHLLKQLNGDGSPSALSKLDPKLRQDAFAPTPTILPTSDILFDAWAQTTIRDKLPGRPHVEPYLHGISDDPPHTVIAWREEVELLTTPILEQNKLTPEDVLDLFPLKPHEQLSGPTFGKNKVFEQLEAIAARDAKREPERRLSAWVVDPDGSVTPYVLAKLVEKHKQNKPVVAFNGRTVILPPRAGGLSVGLLKGDVPFTPDTDYDVSGRWYTDDEMKTPRRLRVRDDDPKPQPVEGMRLICEIDLKPDADEDSVGADFQTSGLGPARFWRWYVRPRSADDDGSKTSQDPVTWDDHTRDVVDQAKRIVAAFNLPADLHRAIEVSARFHDLGKMRELWQRCIGNPKPKEWYAKSGRDPNTGKLWRPIEISTYRHELGSLVDLHDSMQPYYDELDRLPEGMKDLVLHLIAVHHGYGRPHFPADSVFDPDPKGQSAEQIACEVPRRFARLQRKYGRWGLAYLESLLRAADYAASANPTKLTEDE